MDCKLHDRQVRAWLRQKSLTIFSRPPIYIRVHPRFFPSLWFKLVASSRIFNEGRKRKKKDRHHFHLGWWLNMLVILFRHLFYLWKFSTFLQFLLGFTRGKVSSSSWSTLVDIATIEILMWRHNQVLKWTIMRAMNMAMVSKYLVTLATEKSGHPHYFICIQECPLYFVTHVLVYVVSSFVLGLRFCLPVRWLNRSPWFTVVEAASCFLQAIHVCRLTKEVRAGEWTC